MKDLVIMLELSAVPLLTWACVALWTSKRKATAKALMPILAVAIVMAFHGMSSRGDEGTAKQLLGLGFVTGCIVGLPIGVLAMIAARIYESAPSDVSTNMKRSTRNPQAIASCPPPPAKIPANRLAPTPVAAERSQTYRVWDRLRIRLGPIPLYPKAGPRNEGHTVHQRLAESETPGSRA